MKRVIVFFVFLLLIISAGFSQNKTISIAANEWAPFVDSNSPTDGLSLEVVRAAYDTQGYTITMKYMPWTRALNGIIEGEYDIVPDIWFSKERDGVLLFSLPYATNSVKFISTKEDSFNYIGLDSLKGKTIGTIRGYSYSKEFMDSDNFTKDPVDSLMTNVLKLLNGRVDLIIEDEIVAKAIISNERPDILNKLYFSAQSFSEDKLYIAAGLKNPRYNEIINAFNKGLEVIRNNGIYDSIMAKYGIKATN